MSLPVMGLCPDSKRTLNFCSFMKKNPTNSTMLDKGGVSVYPTGNGCSANPVNHRESKFHTYFSQATSFNDKQRFIPSLRFVPVGGFLGSKSQVRSSSPQIFWDLVCTTIVPNILGAATECLKQHCEFHCAPSPPKKKFAKEMGLENLAIVDSQDFPSVIDKQTSPVSPAECPKQSYAEVARAPSLKPSRPNKILNPSSGPRDLTVTRPRRRGNRHRSDSSDCRSRKRSSKQHRSSSDSVSSPTSESQTGGLKDLRLDQKEKHFSHLKTDHNNRNFIKSNRRLSSEQRETCVKEKQQSHSRPKRHMQSRSHCDKRSSGARNFNCDIDKINWRTGEPIRNKMGSKRFMDMDSEEFANDEPFNESLSSELGSGDCNGEVRKVASSPKVFSPPNYSLGGSPVRRVRHPSECSVDSEDSFIVFQTGTTSDDSLSDLTSDYSDSDDTYESDSSEEEDLCDGLSPTSLRLKEVNDLWQKEYQLGSNSVDALSGNDYDVHDHEDGNKKVRFSDSKPTIHRMLTWDFAYRSSRLGPWEQMARDRDRFKTRIRLCESTISPVLSCTHRNKIWKKLHSELS
ncbi:Protein phosphatase 1 regulatory subunit 15A [Frankliniella fusca]|uniref:Protein phosphatase 1 regulatory subunit 15A n=1 Tax=Frankliniella fusca TaxID=407009 RepID=A0AAE1LBH5_9NEOP|nr:Protein phosphatase 1 regulatory subunit 15A [Frankliniella fusca]